MGNLFFSFSGRSGRRDRDLRLADDGRLVAPRARHTAILAVLLFQGKIEIKYQNKWYNVSSLGRSRIREGRYIQTG